MKILVVFIHINMEAIKMNQWELRKLMDKKAKVIKKDGDIYGYIKIKDDIVEVMIFLEFIDADTIDEITVNDVWDSLDYVDIPQEKFDQLEIENVLVI